MSIDRRGFLERSLQLSAGLAVASATSPVRADDDQSEVEVLPPRDRVPLSFVIDDSTCLVNMGHFCMPQFAACYPDRASYQKPWREWPREIPDSFVREFGEWCAEHGVKGKYSIVPNPACVGWLDRELPGWSRKELRASLKLVRDLMVPNFDIHPEMITHTRVIDLKTGRPLEEISPATMENSYPQEQKSVDELAAYLAYALRILKNCDLPCAGITTPGGFGNRVKQELPLAVRQAVADVYPDVRLPHYFKYVLGGKASTEPKMEQVTAAGSDDIQCTVNVPAATGDWFGGWDGVLEMQADRYANADATSGRMVELIERREPAVMLCHWPGLYNNGTKAGLRAFQRIVTALADRYGDQTLWMKLSGIGDYYAAKQFTEIESTADELEIRSRFGTPDFTLRIPVTGATKPILRDESKQMLELREVAHRKELTAGTWLQEKEATLVCFDLPAFQSLTLGLN